MRFVVDTVASPEQARRALVDFTDRRLQIWNRTLDPRTYEVRAQGETWAVARESSPGSPFSVVAVSLKKDPAVVRWAVEESSYGGGGQGRIRITPAESGGSRLHVEWDNTGARPLWKPLLVILHLAPTGRLLARAWRSALNRYAESDENASP